MTLAQIKSKMPLEFIEEIYKNFSPRIADKILIGMSEKRLTTLRVNTIKFNMEDLLKILQEENIEYENVEWYNDALIIKNADEKKIQNLDIYTNGYIYLQSLSSMIPPIILNPKKGEKVLDLTAAPGSKTTQMAAMMENDGYILANELDKIRCERLKYNVNMQGAEIVEVINMPGENVGEKYPNAFDKVLLDVPCSGEGRFLVSDEKTYKNWSTKQVQDLVEIQKQLFESAVKALKVGGEMVYSTCTLNLKENEEIVNYAIKNLNVKVGEINIGIKDKAKGISKGYDSSLKNTIRVLPNKYQEGFFVAKLIKEG